MRATHKLMGLLLAGALTLSLSACGATEQQTPSPAPDASPAVAETEPVEEG